MTTEGSSERDSRDSVQGQPEQRFRAHRRAAVHLRATLRVEGSAWRSEATVLNVSVGGACVALSRIPPEGRRVLLEVSAPALMGAVPLGATVQWTRPTTASEPLRAGLAFDHSPPTEIHGLIDVLASLPVP